MEETYKSSLHLRDIANIPLKHDNNYTACLNINSEVYAWGCDNSNLIQTQMTYDLSEDVDTPECLCGKKLDKYDDFLQNKFCSETCSVKPKCTKCNTYLDDFDNPWERTTCHNCY